MNHELNGDIRLSLLHRFIYILRNFYPNFFFFSFDTSLHRYRVQPYVLSDSQSSQVDFLQKRFYGMSSHYIYPLTTFMFSILVVEAALSLTTLIRCWLLRHYLGVDLSDKFSDQNASNFDCDFINSDIHLLERNTNFYNLIISCPHLNISQKTIYLLIAFHPL